MKETRHKNHVIERYKAEDKIRGQNTESDESHGGGICGEDA